MVSLLGILAVLACVWFAGIGTAGLVYLGFHHTVAAWFGITLDGRPVVSAWYLDGFRILTPAEVKAACDASDRAFGL